MNLLLDTRFGYKVRKDGGDRCFFRFLNGAWHDVLAPHDVSYTAHSLQEILEHELRQGQLVVFGCCCAHCASGAAGVALRFKAAELAELGFCVSHGYWPEHAEAENRRLMEVAA